MTSKTTIMMLILGLIVPLVVFGLLLVLVSNNTTRQVLGFVSIGLGAAAGLAWGLGSSASWGGVTSAERHKALSHELEERAIFREQRFSQAAGQGFEQELLVGTWDTILSPEWEYEPRSCRSRAVIFKDKNKLMIQNCCTDNLTDKVTCATGELHRAVKTHRKDSPSGTPAVFGVEYSVPGAFSPLVVELLRDDLLLLSSGEKLWLLSRRGRKETNPTLKEQLIESMLAASSLKLLSREKLEKRT
jgi:hypothetical protein